MEKEMDVKELYKIVTEAADKIKEHRDLYTVLGRCHWTAYIILKTLSDVTKEK